MSLLLTIFLKFFSVISNAGHAFSYILDYLFLRPYTIYGITMSMNIFLFLIHLLYLFPNMFQFTMSLSIFESSSFTAPLPGLNIKVSLCVGTCRHVCVCVCSLIW